MSQDFRSARFWAAALMETALFSGARAVDATMGNGRDTLWLCQRVGPDGHVYAFDVQPEAVERTGQRLLDAGLSDRATLFCQGHQRMAECVPEPVDAVMFNLGWLPGAAHAVTTLTETTLQAVDAALSFLKAQNAAYAIAIVEDAELRGLTVMPEDRIAVVNATRFKVGGDDVLKPEVRIHKEIWRALGFVSGIGYAPYQNDVLQPVFSVKALDGLEYQVMQPMNFQKMYSDLGKFGISRARRVPYHIAVQEGWASPPTNDVQKAIWKRVHAIPDKPIKIEYDPKRDKDK